MYNSEYILGGFFSDRLPSDMSDDEEVYRSLDLIKNFLNSVVLNSYCSVV